MGGMMRWAVQEAVLRNELKVYGYESNGTEQGAAASTEAEIYV